MMTDGVLDALPVELGRGDDEGDHPGCAGGVLRSEISRGILERVLGIQ